MVQDSHCANFKVLQRALVKFILIINYSLSLIHCAPVCQKNLPQLQKQAFRAVSYLEYHIISKPWAWKPPLLDELTRFGQRQSAPAIPSLYQGKWKLLARAVTSMDHMLKFWDTTHSFDQRPPSD